MAASGPGNVQPHANGSVGPIMRPQSSGGASLSMFPDCWPMPPGNNNHHAPAYWPAMPFGGPFNAGFASAQIGPGGQRSTPSSGTSANTAGQPSTTLLSTVPPISYVHHPMAYYNGNFNCGAGAAGSAPLNQGGHFYDDGMRYPSMMTTSGRILPNGHETTANLNSNSHQTHKSAPSTTLENTTVQIKIQCINHTNPININSPSGLNNVTNMSCHTHATGGNCCAGAAGNPNHVVNHNSNLTTNQANREPTDYTSYANGVNNVSNLDGKSVTKGQNDYGEYLTASDYEMPDVPMVTSASMKLAQFSEITQMAMRGCELAERLAFTHRNRPCFKKIDSLCARMKQDLVRQDSVLANINSQGMAWAVKDFIFVFTRIINAWIIIKGYVYNTPEGLAKVKTSLSADFNDSFLKWQDATMDFVDNLIKSFVNLDQMVQTQRASFQKFDIGSSVPGASLSNKQAHSSSNSSINCNQTNMQQTTSIHIKKREPSSKSDNDLPNDETMSYVMKLFSLDGDPKPDTAMSSSLVADTSPNKSTSEHSTVTYLSNVFQDSEETQRQAMEKGTYFKTGLYNPLKKDLLSVPAAVSLNTQAVQDPKSIFTQANTAPPSTTILNRFVGHNGPSDFETPKAPIEANERRMSHFGIGINSINQNNLLTKTIDEELLCRKMVHFNATNPASDLQFQQHHLQLQYQQLQQHLQLLTPQSQPVQTNHKQQLSVEQISATVDQMQSFPTASKEYSYMTANMEYLLAKICSLNEAKYFFATHFTKNYFPDFQSVVPNFVDLRTIVLRSHIGSYTSLHEAVHDLRQIVYNCSQYLQQRPNEFLCSAVHLFDKELESILSDSLFADYDFSHITGMPDEETVAVRTTNMQASTDDNSGDDRPMVIQQQDQLFCKGN